MPAPPEKSGSVLGKLGSLLGLGQEDGMAPAQAHAETEVEQAASSPIVPPQEPAPASADLANVRFDWRASVLAIQSSEPAPGPVGAAAELKPSDIALEGLVTPPTDVAMVAACGANVKSPLQPQAYSLF